MMLAVSVMSAGWRFAFYLAAVICFVAAAAAANRPQVAKVNIVALGLFFFVVPFMWDALAAT